MAVCSECDISRFHISGFCHQLVTDSVASMYVSQSVFFYKFISFVEMSCIILLTRRNKVIINQNHFIRIMKLCKSHLLKFICYKRNENIMDHASVNINCHDISRLYCLSCIMSDNLFNNRLAHHALLSAQSSSPFSLRIAFTSPPA